MGNRQKAGWLAAATLLLGACAQHQWVPGPSAEVDLGVASGRCKLMALGQPQGGYVSAQGSPRFVATAVASGVIAQGIAGAVQQQNIYNACMEASGFIAMDGAPNAATAPPLVAVAPPPPVPPEHQFGARVDTYGREGVVVVEIIPGGSADRAGLQRGDLIVALGGEKVISPQRLQVAIDHTRAAGSLASIEILRSGKPMQLTVSY